MKKTKILFNSAILLLLFIIQNQNILAQTDVKKTTKTDTLQVTVSEMGCHLDQGILESALYRSKGVKRVFIKDKDIVVIFNPKKTNTEAIISTIENTGTCEDPNDKIHKVVLKSQ